MRKLIKHLFLLGALVLTLPTAKGYGTGGPIGNGGDNWQVPVIAYGLGGDIMAPKNINEEYRRVTPVLYYAYDANWLGFFGLAGTTNVDAAFGIMNALNNVSSYSTDLTEFPLESQQFNYTASAAGLFDLKSYTLTLLVEQMGLVEPERYIWTLHNRVQEPIPNARCPDDMVYLVVQRNYDFVNSPLSQVQYSPYVNGVLYTFQIFEDCTGPNPLAGTVPYSPDPFANTFTAVASGSGIGGSGLSGSVGLAFGGYFTSLTRDDVGGLRALLSSNNINYEATAPSGSLLLETNVQSPFLLTTLPLGLLLSQSVRFDPATLQTNFPGLTIISVQTNYVNQVTTNITPYYTNLSVMPVFSNKVVGGLPLVTHLTNLYYFTNQPGPTIINYDRTVPFTGISTLDLATFSDLSRTNDPATMAALYPGLQILRALSSPAFLGVTNYVFYLTNINGAPYQSPPKQVTAAVSTNYVWITNWTYTYGNVFTNHSSPNRLITVQSIWTTNLVGAPYGSPLVTKTNSVTYSTNKISGDFFLIPTNWCGFDLTLAFPLGNPPYAYGPTNTVIYQGYNTNGATGTNNPAGGNAYGLIQSSYDLYTNYNYAVYPGICESVLVLGTNYFTNIVTTYDYYFGNIVTNHYYTNTINTVWITNIGPCPGGSPDLLCTNVSMTKVTNNQPRGDFFIPSPAWCGYTILSTQLTSVVYITNTITATNTPVPDIGQSYSETTIISFTNTTFLIQPSLCDTVAAPSALRQGIERVQFVRANYDSLLGQFFAPLTNTYSMIKVTNSQPIKEYYQRIITQPDLLMTAQDLAAGPGQWPQSVPAVARGINFDQSNVGPGLAGPGTIIPRTVFTYNKVGSIYDNGSRNQYLLSTNQFLEPLDESTQISILAWGSFDGSTNPPIVYPNGTSLANVVNQLFIQVTPAAVADGYNGTPYTPVTFTATGGQSPYTWAAPNLSTLVPGMTFNTNNATLSGTPSGAGLFNFTLQVTDSANRAVNLNYSLTIH